VLTDLCLILYITGKISKFLQITGIINRTLKPSQVRKHTRLKIYNTLALPKLIYGFETWAITEQDKYRIMSEKITFMRRTAKYNRKDYKSNEDFYQNIKLTQL
jgi:hypothetical protein